LFTVTPLLMLSAKHSTGHGAQATGVKPINFQTETLPARARG
jgi:hypothetical protein